MARLDPSSQPARARALDRLLRIEQEGAYSGLVATDPTDADDAREERQAAEYVSGVTRQRRQLDFLIDAFYRGQADGLEPAVRMILRLGIYDLLILETPPHAAVNESVNLARRRAPRAAGLVNGLLRTVERRRAHLPVPDTGDPAEDLAIRTSVPTWLARRWRQRYGDEKAAALLEGANVRPRYALRINTHRESLDGFISELDSLDLEWEPSRYLNDFVVVSRLQPVLRAGWLDEGRCAVQDEAAGLVVRLMDPQPGETIIDAAAAPGGKAVYAAIRMGDRGRVLAYDVHPARVGLVRQAAEAHGLTTVEAIPADTRRLAEEAERPLADRVLLDAPCSGLGVLAKRADLRWRRTEEQIAELTMLQDEMLDAAAQLVRPGGLLLYSTCTIEPEENAERVETFLARSPDFGLESADGFVPAEMLTREGYYAAMPDQHGTDGAFGARLRRRES
jgi:16S rRNA (cytosine967-C5)-methyltransferase